MPCTPLTPADDSEIKILISTDNHLGYLENHPIRGDDSFRAFEEVLQLAKANQVDMVLLGGDLFHDSQPSHATLTKTMKLLRETCLSSNAGISLAVRSSPSFINYKDPNFSVSLPVFTIHGNHDRVTGCPPKSAVDMLAEARLVTYFGKTHSDSDCIELVPIVLQKGSTSLALYGLGNVHEEDLRKTWTKNGNINWQGLGNDYSCADGQNRTFNLFVLHQNRVTRGSSEGVFEGRPLPAQLDFILWGHEHDSQTKMSTNPPVCQPGSTIATSLIQGESLPKHAVLLKVRGGQGDPTYIPLYTVRSLKFIERSLSDFTTSGRLEGADGIILSLEEIVKKECEKMEREFDELVRKFRDNSFRPQVKVKYPPNQFYTDKLTESVRKPLVRLRLNMPSNSDIHISRQQFGHDFSDRVASSTADILKINYKASIDSTHKFAKQINDNVPQPGDYNQIINGMAKKLGVKNGTSKLEFFRLSSVQDACLDYCDKDDQKQNVDLANMFSKQLEKDLEENPLPNHSADRMEGVVMDPIAGSSHRTASKPEDTPIDPGAIHVKVEKEQEDLIAPGDAAGPSVQSGTLKNHHQNSGHSDDEIRPVTKPRARTSRPWKTNSSKPKADRGQANGSHNGERKISTPKSRKRTAATDSDATPKKRRLSNIRDYFKQR